MTVHSALAVIGAISMFVVGTTTLVRALARLADEHRAWKATRHLVGRGASWIPVGWSRYRFVTIFDAATAIFPPAADADGVISQRLPRGWVPRGRVIDVRVEVRS